MRKLLATLLLAATATACQHKPADTPAIRVPTAQAAPPAATARPTTWRKLAETEATRCDLSRLWAGGDGMYRKAALDGFFGSEYRRISFIFTDVRRDARQPALYYVEGKDLYNKVVSAFKGTITVTDLTRLNLPGLDENVMMDVDFTSPLYSAVARFDFQEYPATRTAGRFDGVAHLDFALDKGKPQLLSSLNYKIDAPAQGAGVLYQGRWLGSASAPAKPLLLSGNALITAPEALTNFAIGDRGSMFNPKYAKLGWNDYWANNEWWADSPKPRLSL